MLIDDCEAIKLFRPPPVEQLTDREVMRLHEVLSRAVDSWRGAAGIGMRVRDLHQRQDRVNADDGADEIWFHVDGLTLALGLTPRAAVSLVCVNLGASMPEDPDTRLTEIDLALLDAWTARALPALVDALDAGPGGETHRRSGRPCLEDCSVTAELTFAGDVPGGRIIIGDEIARRGRESTGETLGKYPELLLHARIGVEATIVSEPVPLPELLSLECGDVLLIGEKTAIEAELTAGNSVVAAGRPGARDGMRALRIKGAVLNDRDDRLEATPDGF